MTQVKSVPATGSRGPRRGPPAQRIPPESGGGPVIVPRPRAVA